MMSVVSVVSITVVSTSMIRCIFLFTIIDRCVVLFSLQVVIRSRCGGRNFIEGSLIHWWGCRGRLRSKMVWRLGCSV